MTGTKGTVERAFELAIGGTCLNVADIRVQLAKEGHENINAHLAGLAIRKQLTAIIKSNAKA
jgi:hypothetical protein